MAIALKIEDAVLNIRTKSNIRDLIDEAAGLLGKNRSEFMLETAIREAQDIILDRAFININAGQFTEIQKLLENPPPINEKLQKLLNKKTAWE